MPRQPRGVVAGDVVHVGSRGALRTPIYCDDRDRAHFERLLAQAVREHDWRCLTYCLMGNHYHLVVMVSDGGLSDGMRDLNGAYATWVNERHGRSGHVFERRFWSKIVRRDDHLIGLGRYIALNPVRAGLCAEAGSWRWSAHQALLGEAPPRFIDVPGLLGYYETDLGRARAAYAATVSASEPVPGRPHDDPLLLELVGWRDVNAAVAHAHHELGHSTRDIARAFGCSSDAIRRRLNRSPGQRGLAPLPG